MQTKETDTSLEDKTNAFITSPSSSRRKPGIHWGQDHQAMCYPAELTSSQNSCQLNIRRISIVCNNVYAISTILLLYYIYVFIFIYLYV